MRALMQGDIGADEDNITPSPRHHVGYHLGGELIGAQQMHLDLRGKGRGTHLVYPAGIHVPGTGYQQIDLPECVNTFRDEGFHGIGIGDVQRKRDGLTAVGADLLDELGQLIHAAGAQRDRKTPTGQFDCGGRPMPDEAPAMMDGRRAGCGSNRGISVPLSTALSWADGRIRGHYWNAHVRNFFRRSRSR